MAFRLIYSILLFSIVCSFCAFPVLSQETGSGFPSPPPPPPVWPRSHPMTGIKRGKLFQMRFIIGYFSSSERQILITPSELPTHIGAKCFEPLNYIEGRDYLPYFLNPQFENQEINQNHNRNGRWSGLWEVDIIHADGSIEAASAVRQYLSNTFWGSYFRDKLEDNGHWTFRNYISGGIGARIRDLDGKLINEFKLPLFDWTPVKNMPVVLEGRDKVESKPLTLTWTLPKAVQHDLPKSFLISFDNGESWFDLEDTQHGFKLERLDADTFRYTHNVPFSDYFKPSNLRAFFPMVRLLYTRKLEACVVDIPFETGAKKVTVHN